MDILSKENCWYRSLDGIVGGVCQGIAEKFSISPWLVRVLWLICIMFFGTGLLLYFILLISLPREDKLIEAQQPVFLGVCTRLNAYVKSDIGLLRTFCCFLAVMSFGATIILYVLLHFILESKN